MTKKEILEELKAQDAALRNIHDRRHELGKIAREKNIYNELWEELVSDGKIHWSF